MKIREVRETMKERVVMKVREVRNTAYNPPDPMSSSSYHNTTDEVGFTRIFLTEINL